MEEKMFLSTKSRSLKTSWVTIIVRIYSFMNFTWTRFHFALSMPTFFGHWFVVFRNTTHILVRTCLVLNINLETCNLYSRDVCSNSHIEARAMMEDCPPISPTKTQIFYNLAFNVWINDVNPLDRNLCRWNAMWKTLAIQYIYSYIS